MSSINSIEDEAVLQKMLSETNDSEQRKVIRNRLLQVKKLNSERREKERLQREQRREDDLKRRNQAQIEENLERMKLYEETAQSFGNKAESKLDKLKEQALKEKQAFIEKERKAEMDRIEKAASQHLSAKIGDSNSEELIRQKQQWALENRQVAEKNLREKIIHK